MPAACTTPALHLNMHRPQDFVSGCAALRSAPTASGEQPGDAVPSQQGPQRLALTCAERLMGAESARSGPAIAARREHTAAVLARVEDAVTRLRLDGTYVTVGALAGHARVYARSRSPASAPTFPGLGSARTPTPAARARLVGRRAGRRRPGGKGTERRGRLYLRESQGPGSASPGRAGSPALYAIRFAAWRRLCPADQTRRTPRCTIASRQLTAEQRTLRQRLDAARFCEPASWTGELPTSKHSSPRIGEMARWELVQRPGEAAFLRACRTGASSVGVYACRITRRSRARAGRRTFAALLLGIPVADAASHSRGDERRGVLGSDRHYRRRRDRRPR